MTVTKTHELSSARFIFSPSFLKILQCWSKWKKKHLHLILDAHIAKDSQSTSIVCTKYVLCLWVHLIVFDSVCFKIPQPILFAYKRYKKLSCSGYSSNVCHRFVFYHQKMSIFSMVLPFSKYCKLIRTQMRNMFVMNAIIMSKLC